MKRPNSTPTSANSGNRFTSYQSGYQPPVHYASDQTNVLEDATKTYYQIDDTAQAILDKMTAQRQQLNSASGNVSQMQLATDRARREILELQAKNRKKKQRLYLWIACMGLLDLLLFFRIIQCRGKGFFC
jgi:hypothetical protein